MSGLWFLSLLLVPAIITLVLEKLPPEYRNIKQFLMWLGYIILLVLVGLVGFFFVIFLTGEWV